MGTDSEGLGAAAVTVSMSDDSPRELETSQSKTDIKKVRFLYSSLRVFVDSWILSATLLVYFTPLWGL